VLEQGVKIKKVYYRFLSSNKPFEFQNKNYDITFASGNLSNHDSSAFFVLTIMVVL
jgi:hypothetical protein